MGRGEKLPPLTGCQFSYGGSLRPSLCVARVMGSRRRALKPRKPFVTLAPTILTREIVWPPA